MRDAEPGQGPVPASPCTALPHWEAAPSSPHARVLQCSCLLGWDLFDRSAKTRNHGACASLPSYYLRYEFLPAAARHSVGATPASEAAQ